MAEKLEELIPEPATRAMRVAVISMHASPAARLGAGGNGGMNVYLREVCRKLAEGGIETDVFTLDGAHTSALAPGARVIPVLGEAGRRDKYRLLDLAPRFAARVRAHAAAKPYEAVYSHYWLSGAVGALVAPVLGIPWVHTAHTLGLVKNRSLPAGASAEPPSRIQVETRIARSADLLVANTEAERSDLLELYAADAGRVVVVPPGVNLDLFTPRPDPQRRGYILFVGRLERLKGAEIAIRALALLAQRHPPAELVIAGDDSSADGGGEKDRLRALARELRVSERVDFVNAVGQEHLPDLYSGASVCVMPSYSESFGLVALEAQACGRPVVGARVPGLEAIVRDGVTGYLVDGWNPADYADCLGRLLADEEAADQMGLRGRLLSQRFTWARTAELVGAHLRRLAARTQVRVQASATQE